MGASGNLGCLGKIGKMGCMGRVCSEDWKMGCLGKIGKIGCLGSFNYFLDNLPFLYFAYVHRYGALRRALWTILRSECGYT